MQNWTELTIEEARQMYGKLGYNIEDTPPLKGGFKQVFRAIYQDKLVALKVLHNLEDSLYKRAQREVDLMMEIDSPYIAKVYDYNFGSPGLKGFIAEEYISGSSLDKKMESPVPFDETLRIVDNLFQALLVLVTSGRNVVHRDVKPDNILIRANGDAVLTDFGLARQMGASTLTPSGIVLGTPKYSPPEFIVYDRNLLNQTSDLFSLGIIFYELLTGQHPFVESGNGGSLYQQMLSAEATSVADLMPSINPKLSRFVMRLIERQLNDRYPSTHDAYQRFNKIRSS